MKLTFSFSLLLVLSFASALAETDLTPTVREYTNEGILFRRVSFTADDRSVTYVPPFGWSIRGGKDRLQLAPNGKNFIEATVQATPLEKPQPFDELTLQTFERQVLAEVPAGSQGTEIISREENTVPMGENPSYKFVVAYTALGKSFQRSVVFVHTPTLRLSFRLTAPKSDFPQMDQSFRTSLSSWQWSEKKAPQNVVSTAAAPAADEPKPATAVSR